MRFLLGFDAHKTQPSIIRENAAFAEGHGDEPMNRANHGVFHLILILRVLDISLFHEGKGGEENVMKIPKRLETPIHLMASYV